MQDTGCRIQDAGYRMQDTGCRIQDAGYRMQDILDHGSWISSTQCCPILHRCVAPTSATLCVVHLASWILHPLRLVPPPHCLDESIQPPTQHLQSGVEIIELFF